VVSILHSGENIEKINAIIEAARKRFGLYGLQKTTMREIASDMNISKGLLYYYFPDKEDLYKAVIEKEQDEFIHLITEKIKLIDDPVEMLREYVKVRLDYFREVLNWNRFNYEEFKGLKPIMSNVWKQFHARETEIIRDMLLKGKEKGTFKIDNTDETAVLFLDILKGLRATLMSKKEFFYLEEVEYEMLVKKINMFTTIFINGLRYKSDS
jgi:AcrR family transcriptional regulator